jgi:predicted amidohydrolase
VKLAAAAIQMTSAVHDVSANLGSADELLRRAHGQGAELAVLPEMFNTGYGLCPDYSPVAETRDGPTLRHLRERSRRWRLTIAAGFVERHGHHLYDSVALISPGGPIHVYRKRHLVFWERSRFRPGRAPLIVPTPWGRIGFAICADMIYRTVWHGYRDRIDLAVIAAAWPDFADRVTGRKHWLLGHVGPLSAAIPGRVAMDLGIPVVFANQCGDTRTIIPFLARIADRFAGHSCVCDGRHGEPVRAGAGDQVVVSSVTIHPQRGLKSWHTMSPSAPAGSSSGSAPASSGSSTGWSTGDPSSAAADPARR